jgi:hypothetical protein
VAVGCGLRLGSGDAVELNPADLAGDGLTAGGGCAFNVDWSQAPVGCGLWWNGSALEVAHDELAGSCLVIGTRADQNRFIDCPVRFQSNRLKNFFPSEWHREHQIVYVKADLLKVAGRVPGAVAV